MEGDGEMSRGLLVAANRNKPNTHSSDSAMYITFLRGPWAHICLLGPHMGPKILSHTIVHKICQAIDLSRDTALYENGLWALYRCRNAQPFRKESQHACNGTCQRGVVTMLVITSSFLTANFERVGPYPFKGPLHSDRF